MEGGYVPTEVRSRVMEGSVEGTEVILKRKYLEKIPLKGARYYTWEKIGDVCGGLLFGSIFFFVVTFVINVIANYIIRNLLVAMVSALVGYSSIIIGIISLVMGPIADSLKKRYVTIINAEKESQMSIFFPKVSISNVNDIKKLSGQTIDHQHNVVSIDWSRDDFNDAVLRSPYHFGISDDGFIDYFNKAWEDSAYADIITLIGDETSKEVGVSGYHENYPQSRWCAILYCPDLYNKVKIVHRECMQQAFERRKKDLEYLEKVGRYEEAARIYEKLDMPEKAGEMRRKKYESKVVRLDLNALIKELGEKGFTVTYRCSNCGAPLRVSGETNAEALKSCSHCGSKIETIDLARFIKSCLS